MTYLCRKATLVLLFLLLSAVILTSSAMPANAAKFSVKVSPTALDVSPGIPGYFSIRVNSLSGFQDAVYLSLDTLPDGFPSATAYGFEPNVVTPPANGFAYAYLKLDLPSGLTTGGEYTLKIIASGGQETIASSVVVKITFPAENFGISASPPSQPVVAGDSTSFTVNLAEMGKIMGQVTLVAYDFPDQIQVQFQPPTVRPVGFSTLSLSTSNTLAAGTYYLAIGGEYQSQRHTAIIGLTVSSKERPVFDLQIQPPVRYIAPGKSTDYTILVVSKGGFSSPVSLTVKDVPSGVKASLSAAAVTPPAGQVGYSILSISAAASAPTGTFTMTITGTSGTLIDSISAMLTITTTSQFAVAVTPSTRTITPGQTVDYEVSVSSIGQFSSEVSLDLQPFTGIDYDFNPASVTPPAGGTAKSTLTVKASDKVATGTYTLIVKGTSKQVVQLTSASLIITTVFDFILESTPAAQAVSLGESTSFSLSVKSMGGFASQVALNLASVPAGVTFSFVPTSVTPSPDTPATSTLKLTTTASAQTGTYTVVIVGASTSIVHSSEISLTITPAASYMTISLSTSSVKQTASIVVSGSMSPAVAGALVTLSYTKPDGSTTDRQVQTGQDGTFSDTLAGSDTTPLDVGTWEVYASWEGDQAHTGAKTQTVSFQVTETPFIERYATVLGAVAVVVIVALAGGVFYFRSKKGAPPVEKKPPTREAVISGRPAPILVEVPRPTPVIVEVPTPTPVVVETRPAKPAPPLILPRKRCFNCGEVISAQAKFCDKCRAPQPEKIEKKYEAPSLIIPRKYCVNCGEVISAQATFCDKCRAPQPG